MAKLISTSELSRRLNMPTAALFTLLQHRGWITRSGDGWQLTAKGEFEGGQYVDSDRFGKYIGWPQQITDHRIFTDDPEARRLGHDTLAFQLGLPTLRCRMLLRELGWIRPGLKGWLLTDQGRHRSGQQFEDSVTAVPDVNWPREIVADEELQRLLAALAPHRPQAESDDEEVVEPDLFAGGQDSRARQVGLCVDGHRLETLAEWRICEWLYLFGIAHACRHRLPLEETHYGDFYLPRFQVYIDYWGDETRQGELAAALERKRAYDSHGIRHIELRDSDLDELDDVLPRRLLRLGIVVD